MIKFLLKVRQKLKALYFTTRVRLKAKSVGTGLKCNGKVKVNRKTILANNVNMNGLYIRGKGEVSIGDNFHSGPECIILTQNHNFNGNKIPYDHTYNEKKVTIQENVWIGIRVIIMPGVTLGEGCIIQAGSVVVNDIPKYAIAGGHPAKVFSQRDSVHYEKLKIEKAFN